MRNLIVIAILAGLAWFGYNKYQAKAETLTPSAAAPAGASSPASSMSAPFKCDGRTHCSQMTSCAEATYFVQHCPNTKMDGNNDGVPCERQWCRQ